MHNDEAEAADDVTDGNEDLSGTEEAKRTTKQCGWFRVKSLSVCEDENKEITT
jgi:hypothetical protein